MNGSGDRVTNANRPCSTGNSVITEKRAILSENSAKHYKQLYKLQIV